MEIIIKSKKYGNKTTLIDEDDYEKIKKFTWYAHKGLDDKFRATATYSNKENIRKTIKLSRFIMNNPKGKVVDHINGNTLDNRKDNLRVCTNAENIRNSIKPKNGVTSKFKGVYFDKLLKKYRAQIGFNRKIIHLGCFINEEDAALSYNENAIKLFGEFAKLNKF
jgi:hypothetical protein